MNVLLVCYAGMSTSLLAEKLEDEGARRGIDITVSAVPLANLEENLEGSTVCCSGHRYASPRATPVRSLVTNARCLSSRLRTLG